MREQEAPYIGHDCDPRRPDSEKVICPACCTKFWAIPVNVQQLMLDAGFEPPFTAAPAPQAQQGEQPATDGSTWAAYIAGVICLYMKCPLDAEKEKAIAGIIERRLWSLSKAAPPKDWLLIKNILDEYGLSAIDFVADFKKATAQAQQPLTDEQIKAGRTEGYDAEDTPDAWDFEQGVRFAERHHGIGEKQ